MNSHDVDLAVKRLRRRLDKIMACASGHLHYEQTAAYVEKLRKHLDAATTRRPTNA